MLRFFSSLFLLLASFRSDTNFVGINTNESFYNGPYEAILTEKIQSEEAML